MQGYRTIIAINIVVLLILCAFAVGFGFHGGAGQATASTQTTPSQTPSMAGLSQPLQEQTSADSLRAANADLVELLQRALSSQQSQIDDLREQAAKSPEHADKNVRKASESSSESLATQFDRFAGRFVAAVDNTVQNSKPNPAERKGTRTLKVSLISDELTSTGDDQPAQGVLLLKQSEDFQSDDGGTAWSREWVFRYSFVIKDGRWHCLGGTCRMDRDDNSSRAGKSPFIGDVITVDGGSWDDLDIQ